MNNIIVNEKLCKKCGVCISECPMNILEQDSQKIPVLSKDKEEMCNKCGHCEASCPQKAIYLESDKLEGSSIPKSSITKDQINYHIRNRRSTRKYKDKIVDKKIIEEIFNTVRYAPSGMNVQPINWMIIHDKNEIVNITNDLIKWMKDIPKDKSSNSPIIQMITQEQIDINSLETMWNNGLNPIFWQAPHLAISYTHKDIPTGYMDSMIALSYLDITLPAYNLGCCWAGFFYLIVSGYPELSKKIGIPEDHTITGAIMFGYPAVKYHNIPKRNKVNIIWK